MGKVQKVELDPSAIADVARLLTIVDHETGYSFPWEPNEEQMLSWADLCENRRNFFLKGRQIGITTSTLLFDIIWVSNHDFAGHPVSLALVWDTEAKVKKIMKTAARFCRQLGLECDIQVLSITFPNGSVIDAMTAGGEGAGRSLSYQRFHCSEVPWWNNAKEVWVGMLQGLGLSGECTIETTMEMKDPTAADIWNKPSEFNKRFFDLEMHTEYRRDPSELHAETEAWLREEGFTRKDTMAWFVWCIENNCAGDTHKAFREYPQLPRHAFAAAEGRWTKVTPKILKPIYTKKVDGLSGERWNLDIFRSPADGSREYLIGVDTSEGKELDASAVVVVDARDGQICAAIRDNTIPTDDLAIVAQAAQDFFTVEERGRPLPIPKMIVEINGIGKTTSRHLDAMGVTHIRIKMDGEQQYNGLLMVKRAIEAGVLFGPEDLKKECDSLRIENGKFKGKKDLKMAIGFTYTYRKMHPARRSDEDAGARERYDLKERMKTARRRERRR